MTTHWCGKLSCQWYQWYQCQWLLVSSLIGMTYLYKWSTVNVFDQRFGADTPTFTELEGISLVSLLFEASRFLCSQTLCRWWSSCSGQRPRLSDSCAWKSMRLSLQRSFTLHPLRITCVRLWSLAPFAPLAFLVLYPTATSAAFGFELLGMSHRCPWIQHQYHRIHGPTMDHRWLEWPRARSHQRWHVLPTSCGHGPISWQLCSAS